MPIVTDFQFEHAHSGVQTLAKIDRLGPLRAFVGPSGKRSWKGTGFNMIWRPNHNKQTGSQPHFLELNLTTETLDFKDITGSGVANRGLLEDDIFMGALAYLQQVADPKQGPQHFEPGVWANVPATTDPKEAATVVRMGSIPHGTTINAQGIALASPTGQPVFTDSSIIPFKLGTPDDGNNLVNFPENLDPLSTNLDSRTAHSLVPALDDAHLKNPTKFLTDGINGLTIKSTEVFIIATDLTQKTPAPVPSAPDIGGGTANIANLVGTADGPNARGTRMSAVFWVEDVVDHAGKHRFFQLQYTQRVILDFNNLSWPHVSVATLRPDPLE